MNPVKKKLVLHCTTREERQQCDEPELPGRLPRITRLMALAIRCDELLRTGKVRALNTSRLSATSASHASRESSA
ncbi:MAG: hypothetical protein MUC43_15090 [Pirellula sp.]|jgi:hypothetical protein|nr:hypothetical protein [Pirellula sp.]